MSHDLPGGAPAPRSLNCLTRKAGTAHWRADETCPPHIGWMTPRGDRPGGRSTLLSLVLGVQQDGDPREHMIRRQPSCRALRGRRADEPHTRRRSRGAPPRGLRAGERTEPQTPRRSRRRAYTANSRPASGPSPNPGGRDPGTFADTPRRTAPSRAARAAKRSRGRQGHWRDQGASHPCPPPTPHLAVSSGGRYAPHGPIRLASAPASGPTPGTGPRQGGRRSARWPERSARRAQRRCPTDHGRRPRRMPHSRYTGTCPMGRRPR